MTQPDLQQGCLYPESKALQTKQSLCVIKSKGVVPGERFLSFWPLSSYNKFSDKEEEYSFFPYAVEVTQRD